MKPVIIKRWDSDDLKGYHYTSNASDAHSDDLFIIASLIEDIGPTRELINHYSERINKNEIDGVSFDQSLLEVKGENIHLNYHYAAQELPDVIMTKDEFFKLLDQWFEAVKKLPKEIVVKKTDTGYSIHPKEGTAFWASPKDIKKD